MLAAVKKGRKINEDEMPPPVATGKSSSHLPGATGVELENSGDTVSVLPENKAESAADDEQKTSHEAVQHLESESLQGHAASSPTMETGTMIWEDKQSQHYLNATSFLILVLCRKALLIQELPCWMFQIELSVCCWISGSGISYCYRAFICAVSIYFTYLFPCLSFSFNIVTCGIPSFKAF